MLRTKQGEPTTLKAGMHLVFEKENGNLLVADLSGESLLRPDGDNKWYLGKEVALDAVNEFASIIAELHGLRVVRDEDSMGGNPRFRFLAPGDH